MPDFSDYTDDGLLAIYDAIGEALRVDDSTAPGAPKRYGVRRFPDWLTHRDALEAEIKKRNLSYTPVRW